MVRVADPEVGSVPACAVTKYWDELTPSCCTKYYPDGKSLY